MRADAQRGSSAGPRCVAMRIGAWLTRNPRFFPRISSFSRPKFLAHDGKNLLHSTSDLPSENLSTRKNAAPCCARNPGPARVIRRQTMAVQPCGASAFRELAVARLNVEQRWWEDPRRLELVEMLGDEEKADGKALKLWRTAQKHSQKNELVPATSFNLKRFQPLIDVGLAELQPGGIYARGAKELFKWLDDRSAGGRTRQDAPRDGGGRFAKAEAVPEADIPPPDDTSCPPAAAGDAGPAFHNAGPAASSCSPASSSPSLLNSSTPKSPLTPRPSRAQREAASMESRRLLDAILRTAEAWEPGSDAAAAEEIGDRRAMEVIRLRFKSWKHFDATYYHARKKGTDLTLQRDLRRTIVAYLLCPESQRPQAPERQLKLLR